MKICFFDNTNNSKFEMTIDLVKKVFGVLCRWNKGLLAYKLFCLSTVLFVSFLDDFKSK